IREERHVLRRECSVRLLRVLAADHERLCKPLCDANPAAVAEPESVALLLDLAVVEPEPIRELLVAITAGDLHRHRIASDSREPGLLIGSIDHPQTQAVAGPGRDEALSHACL